MQYTHQSVLLFEAIEQLDIKSNGIYIDGTFGRGGHAKLILSKLGKNGRLIAIDRDLNAINEAKKIVDDRFTIIHGEFSNLKKHLKSMDLIGKIDGLLLDLGVSSPQIDDATRGFSFMRDGPLDMRMDTTKGIPASEWLQKVKVEDLAFVLKTFGEERFAKKIAGAIVAQNQIKPITTTLELANLITKVSPSKNFNKHAATRSFQAIRIYLNSELSEVEMALTNSIDLLANNARLAVISFHSLEDRIVKQFIAKHSKSPELPKGLPMTDLQIKQLASPAFKKLAKIKPTQHEINANLRARSAILRVAMRVR